VALAGGRIAGIVSGDPALLREAWVRVTGAGVDHAERVRHDGTFEFRALPHGRYRVEVCAGRVLRARRVHLAVERFEHFSLGDRAGWTLSGEWPSPMVVDC
jgi:hypothetical protein